MPNNRKIVALEMHGLPGTLRSLRVIWRRTLLMYRLPAKRRSLLFRPGTDIKRHRLTGGTVNPLIDGVPAVAVVTGAIRTFKGAHWLPANAASRRNGRAKATALAERNVAATT